MKGILHKTKQGWIVIYDQILCDGIVKRNQNALPLHPDFIEMMDTCFTSKFSQEVEFEMVNIWENGEVGVNGLTYAKLIHHSVDTNEMIFSQTEISDDKLFQQAIKAMEEMYGSGCDSEIDAFFRGAKWMQQQLKQPKL